MSSISGKQAVSTLLDEVFVALQQGEQEESESRLSALKGAVQRFLKPIHNPPRGIPSRSPGFIGDEHGLDHEKLQRLEININKAQSYVRGRNLHAAATIIRQSFGDWTD